MLGHHHSDDVPMSYVQDESFDEGISFTRIPSGSGGGGDGEQDVQRLWKLLEKKDADLQKAARLGGCMWGDVVSAVSVLMYYGESIGFRFRPDHLQAPSASVCVVLYCTAAAREADKRPRVSSMRV